MCHCLLRNIFFGERDNLGRLDDAKQGKKVWLNEEAGSKDLSEGRICSTFFIECVHCHAIKNKNQKLFTFPNT